MPLRVQTCLKLDNSPYLQGKKKDTVYGKVVILHEAYIKKGRSKLTELVYKNCTYILFQ